MASSSAAHDDGHGGHDDGAVHAHVAHPLFYWGVFSALIVLTIVTVGVSYFDFGSMNTVIALLVATMKATLVAVFFMHLAHDSRFNALCLIAAFVFLGIFYLFTAEDLFARNRVDEVNGATVLPAKGEEAPGGINLKVLQAPAGHGGSSHH